MPKYLTSIDLAKNELQNARIQNLAAEPGTPVVGQIYFNTATQKYGIYTSGGWKYLSVDGHTHAIADVTGLIAALDGKIDDNDVLAALAGLTSTEYGFITLGSPAGIPTPVKRAIVGTAGEVTVANGDGEGGNPTVSLPNVGAAGTYRKVTTDAKGRVTSGENPTTLSGYGITDAVPASEKGAANGVATLDAGGKVPSAQLPSFVDDVLEFADTSAFPITGTVGVIYVALDTNKTYRWGGSAYVEISASPGSTDAVPEGSVNKYYTDERAQDAVGSILTDSTTMDFTYDDAAGTITVTRKALTGDVTAPLNSNATTIAANAVTNAKAADMAANTIKGNNTGAVADPKDLTVAQVKTMLAYTPADVGAARKYAQNVGDGVATTISVGHNFNTKDVVVLVYEVTSGKQVFCDVVLDLLELFVNFAVAPSANQYRVVVIG